MDRAGRPLELRVLAGPQAGARAPLSPGRACRIGTAGAGLPAVAHDAPDILLHAAAGFLVRMDWPGDAAAIELHLLDGSGRLGPHELAAGARQPWPMRQRLVLGEVVLAWGPADEAQWSESAPAPGREEPAASAASAVATPTTPGLERWLLTAGAGLTLACIALLFMVDVLTPAQAGLSTALAPAAMASPAGAGADSSEAERRANAVAEVFRLHGVTVQAQARADGTVLVQAQERDSWRVEQAEKAARRDVPGLAGLSVRNQPPAAAATGARPPLQADAGKRITAVVDHTETPYFVTADGSRYFVGALLPSGHRVLQIADQSVTVERDGQLTRLTL